MFQLRRRPTIDPPAEAVGGGMSLSAICPLAHTRRSGAEGKRLYNIANIQFAATEVHTTASFFISC
jgi:hypothetical protein